MKKLLFITHESSRTGAPILLLYLVKWFKKHHNEIEITLLSLKKGGLSSEFNAVVDCYYEFLDEKDKATKVKNSYLNKLKRKLFSNRKQRNFKDVFFEKIANNNWDLIFSNTIVNGEVLDALKLNEAPIISYIHELSYSINKFVNDGKAKGTLDHSDFFLCGSKLVRETLINNYKINKLQTEVVHSFLNFESKTKDLLVSKSIKEELAIPSDAMVVGMMGSFIWRKGIDFFVETAKKLRNENIYFVWIGVKQQELINQIEYDLKHLKIKLNIIFVPPSLDYYKYFNIIDVFYLSSKEDPYPMVMVEATSYGIPMLCFENAGGTQEFIDSKVGFVIPYGDIDIAASRIQFYNENREVLLEHLEYIKEKSKVTHNVNINALRIFDIIERFIK